MHAFRYLPIVVAPALLLTMAAWAWAADPAVLVLSFHPVGTPEFMGPPKIGQPGFVPPVAELIAMPTRAECFSVKGIGEYEALIAADGTVASIHSHHDPVDGDHCERTYLFPYIAQWRFKPATYAGKPTPVFMWFGLGL
ncbi:MAG: hypothetical protein BWK76_06485 [Desulfobulbaceae bacterium A2]|nr:MAG: hypothetical protein BWK76_06485 [Desulfobulbaceae bacterium A2]